MLRKTKRECLDLPPKHRRLCDINLSSWESRQYNAQLDLARRAQAGDDEPDPAGSCPQAAVMIDSDEEAAAVAGPATGGQQQARADMSARGQLFRLRNLASSAKASAAVDMAVAFLEAGKPVVVATCFK